MTSPCRSQHCSCLVSTAQHTQPRLLHMSLMKEGRSARSDGKSKSPARRDSQVKDKSMGLRIQLKDPRKLKQKEKLGREETGGEEERKVVRESGLGLTSGTHLAFRMLRLQLCGLGLDQTVSRIRQLWKGWKCHWQLHSGRHTFKDCLVFLGSQAGSGEGGTSSRRKVTFQGTNLSWC